MSKSVLGWLSVIGSGASGASAAIVAGDHITGKVATIAALAFLVGIGMAARALYTPKPEAEKPAP